MASSPTRIKNTKMGDKDFLQHKRTQSLHPGSKSYPALWPSRNRSVCRSAGQERERKRAPAPLRCARCQRCCQTGVRLVDATECVQAGSYFVSGDVIARKYEKSERNKVKASEDLNFTPFYSNPLYES